MYEVRTIHGIDGRQVGEAGDGVAQRRVVGQDCRAEEGHVGDVQLISLLKLGPMI